MNDVSQQILFANIAFSAAILIVLLLRKPVRAGFGARLAYALRC
jgi:beta-lactamase regulating signal transducer with metallopeptidase domain